MVLKNVPSI